MIRITTAQPPDIPALCLLLHTLFAQEAEFTPDVEAQRRGLARIIADPACGLIVVARENEKIVGMANMLFTVSTALGARVALLEDMVVEPDARGRGVGSLLLRETLELARQSGCRRISLLTDQANESAQRFYRKQGFALSTMVPMRLILD